MNLPLGNVTIPEVLHLATEGLLSTLKFGIRAYLREAYSRGEGLSNCFILYMGTYSNRHLVLHAVILLEKAIYNMDKSINLNIYIIDPFSFIIQVSIILEDVLLCLFTIVGSYSNIALFQPLHRI